jgi:tetratricopeptide (TPR) repeat protein
LGEEIIAAFSEDGIVTASTAEAAPAGTGPAYALGGTLRQDGDKIKLIVRLTNERSGAALWSNSFSYEAKVAPRLPRVAGAEVSSIVRCGLFGASTHPRLLPDPTLTNYLGFCTQLHTQQGEPSKALDFARKVTKATPDFSTGWSAVTIAALAASRRVPPGPQRVVHEKEALTAADRAIRLDPRNSEAFAYKSYLIDPRDLVGREALLKEALKARPLACGCEHHFYGDLLAEAGRSTDALVEYRRAVDVLALNMDSQIAYADALLAAGRTQQAGQHFEAAKDLMADPERLAEEIAVTTAPLTRDYAAALRAVQTTKQPVPPPVLSALTKALQALLSGDAAAKSQAAKDMAALPPQVAQLSVRYLGALGANRLALGKVEEAAGGGRYGARKWLFEPSMAGARADPAFPAVAERLGLMAYWRKTGARPDFCSAKDAPAVCRSI